MKNALLTFLVLGFCFQLSHAQITLDSDDFPQAGDTPTYSVADTLIGIDVSQTGPNQTWDFSNLTPISQSTDSFLSKNDLPFTLRFSIPTRVNSVSFINTPDSVPGVGISLTGGYDLYAVTSDAYENLGQATVLGGLLPIVLNKDPSDTIFALPLNYQDAGGGFSYADIDLTIPTIGDVYYEQSRDRAYEADGWGQLVTPWGQFQTLRTRTTISGSDSTNFTLSGGNPTAFRIPIPEQISYEWWANDERAPILRISAVNFGGNETVTRVEYRDSMRVFAPNSIDQKFAEEPLTIYPNPAADVTTISWDMRGKAGYLELFDMNGKVVKAMLVQSAEKQLRVKALQTGTYLVRLMELDGNRVFLGKMVKQ